MLDIKLPAAAEAAFLSHVCRYTDRPVYLRRQNGRLLARDLSPAAAAGAMAFAAFPCREKHLLRWMIRKTYRREEGARQEILTALAQMAAEEDIPNAPLYQGAGRLERLNDAFLACLAAERRLDLDGFCRFRMPGYPAYLRELTKRAGETLARRDDDTEYYRLLSASLGKGRSEVTLFFSEDGTCSIWQNGASGIRHVEGGRIRGVEWLVTANLMTMAPSRLELRDSVFAPPLLVDMLSRIFGDRLIT